MPSRTVTIKINTQADLAGLQTIIDGLDKLKDLNKNFGAVPDFKQMAKDIRSLSTSTQKMNNHLPETSRNLAQFVGIVKQLDKAVQGVPLELKALAGAIKETAKSTKVLNDSNKNMREIANSTRKTTIELDRFGNAKSKIEKTSSWKSIADGENVIKRFEKSFRTAASAMVDGKWQKIGSVFDKTVQAGQRVTKMTDVQGNEVVVLHHRLEGLTRVYQNLLKVLSSFASIGGRGIAAAFKGMNQFATNSAAMFSRLRNNLSASGGLFTSFHKRVEDSMARSKRATLDFLNSGWSFLTSGYTIRQFGLNSLGGVSNLFKNYTEYERNLVRTSVAASETGTPDPALIQDIIFGMQRGQYGAPVKQFNPTEIADAFYFYASAIGKNITADNAATLAPVITDFLQIANVTRTDPETVTKGVINVMTEFGINPREDENSGRARDIAQEMAYLSNKSTLEFADIAESFKMVGPMAGVLGATPEDAMALLYFMSEVGLRGGQAGRGISQTFSRILDPTQKMLGLSQRYGLTKSGTVEEWRALFMDNNGQLRGGVQGMLNTIMSAAGKDENAKGLAAQIIAEMFSENATRTLVGSISQMFDDPNAWQEIMSVITGNLPQDWLAGAIKANNDSLSAAFSWLQSAWFQVTTTMVDAVKGPLIDALDTVTQLLFKLTDILKNNPAISKFALGLITIVGSLASFVGTAFIALGSLLLMAKAFNLTHGFGFKLLGVLAGMATTFLRLAPMFLLFSVLSGVIATAWKNDFGGIATFLSNANFADIMGSLVVNMTKGLATLGQAWFEFINLVSGGEGVTDNFRKVLDSLFGSFLGPVVFGKVLDLRDAVAALKEELLGLARGTGIRDIGAVLSNAFGAGRGILSAAISGHTPPKDLAAAYDFLRGLGVDNPVKTFDEIAGKVRYAMRYVQAFAQVLWTELRPSVLSVVGLFQALWDKLVDGEAIFNFIKNAVVGFIATISAFVIIAGKVASVLTDITDRLNGLSGTLGTVAGIIVGVMVVRALLPFDKAIVLLTAHLADFIIRTVLLGGLQAIFTGLGMAMQAAALMPIAGLVLLGAAIFVLINSSEEMRNRWIAIFRDMAGVALDIAQGLMIGFGLVIAWGASLLEILSPVIALLTDIANRVDALKYIVAGLVAYAAVAKMLALIGHLFGVNSVLAQIFGTKAARSMGMFALAIFALAPAFTWLFEKLGMSADKAEKLGLIAGVGAGTAAAAPGTTAKAGRYAAKGGKYVVMTAAGAAVQSGVAAMALPATATLVAAGGTFYLLDKATDQIMTPEDFQFAYQTEVTAPVDSIRNYEAPFYGQGTQGTNDYLDSLLYQRNAGNPNYVPTDFDREWAFNNELKNEEFNRARKFYDEFGILPNGRRYLDVPQVTETGFDPGYIDLETGKTLSAVQAEALMFDQDQGRGGLAGQWVPSDKYQMSAEDKAALDTTDAAKNTQSLMDQIMGQVGTWFGGLWSDVDTSSVSAFMKSTIGTDLNLNQMLDTFNIDPSKLTISETSFLTGQELIKAQQEQALQIAIEEGYRKRTGKDLPKGYFSRDKNIEEMVKAGGPLASGVGFGLFGVPGEVDQAALDDVTNEALRELADKSIEAAQALDQMKSSFLSAIESISLQDALKGLFDPLAGKGGHSAASVLGQYSGKILENLQTAVGSDITLPWQNEFELMMDAAGTGGPLGTNMAGKNLHKALLPFLETFAAQSGIDPAALLKDIPMFYADERYTGMAQADLMQRVQGFTPGIYENLDLLGSGQFGTEVFDTEGFDWTELANYAAAQAEQGFMDWNLTDYIMEAWDMTREDAEAYIQANGLSPNVISGADFKDTKLYADSLGGEVNVITQEWMDYLNLVTANGTDKTIEITQKAFDQLPDIVKIAYSKMGYQFVIGGDQTNQQLMNSYRATKDVIEDTYGDIPDNLNQLLSPITEGGSGWFTTLIDGVRTVYDAAGNVQFTMPENDYQAWIESNNALEKETARLEELKDRLLAVKEQIRNLQGSRDKRDDQVEQGGAMASGVGFGLYMGVDSELAQLKQDANDIREDLGWITENGLPSIDFDWNEILPDQAEIEEVANTLSNTVITAVTTKFTEKVPEVGAAVNALVQEVVNKLTTGQVSVQTAAQGIVNTIDSTLRVGVSAVIQAGYALGEAAGAGVLSGLQVHLGEIRQAVADIIAAANVGNGTAPPAGGGGGSTGGGDGAPVAAGHGVGFVASVDTNRSGATSLSFAASQGQNSTVTQPRQTANGPVSYNLNIATVNASNDQDVTNLISRVNAELGNRYELERRGVNATPTPVF